MRWGRSAKCRLRRFPLLKLRFPPARRTPPPPLPDALPRRLPSAACRKARGRWQARLPTTVRSSATTSRAKWRGTRRARGGTQQRLPRSRTCVQRCSCRALSAMRTSRSRTRAGWRMRGCATCLWSRGRSRRCPWSGPRMTPRQRGRKRCRRRGRSGRRGRRPERRPRSSPRTDLRPRLPVEGRRKRLQPPSRRRRPRGGPAWTG
mmetsp:Transcript_20840/g.52445  ORF Transcript_20840/g.52445 Transcript_20840/m.52445 type:complete len:205 (+) Transcript_20840:445-1059(+)